MRAAALALACALVGAVAVLAIGSATGLVGDSTQTIVVREAPAAVNTPAARAVLPFRGTGFAPARIYAERSPGVVTVYSTVGGTSAQGSGFVVSGDGLVLTNAHVITSAGSGGGTAVRPASAVYVEFKDRDRVPARIVGWDVFDDVGVLQVDPRVHALTPLPLGRSAGILVGAPVAAIGSPLGNADSLAVGIVSAVRRSIAALTVPRFQLVDAIQTDAPIAHGSSGGPLLDAHGRVIGINAQIRSDQGSGSGVGFAVPIDAARRSVRELVAKGRVDYAYAGIQAEDVTPSLARHLRLSVTRGALVDEVPAGGPAARAGLRGSTHEELFEGEAVQAGGDVVVRVGRYPVRGAADLVRIVTNKLRPGATVRFRIVRGGRQLVLPVRLALRQPG
jgi:S1-C subfamily serine protease